MKQCNACKEFRSPESFHKRAASVDGLSYTCVACAKRRSRQQYAKDPQAWKDATARWSRENKELINERQRDWRKRNKEKRQATCKAWNERNRAKRAEQVARRRAKIVTPLWADANAISGFYKRAKQVEAATGIKHHVDHIVPLNSPLVCGLHVESNLQVIPASENVLKRNLVWPDMP